MGQNLRMRSMSNDLSPMVDGQRLALGPGRPATARLDRQLHIELRRLTSCGARSLGQAVSRIKDKGELPCLARPTETSLKRSFSAGNADVVADRDRQMRELPGWCKVHIVPVIVNLWEVWDMALMWEPFSRAIFGTITPSFREDGEEIIEFVIKSLHKLPSPLVERIQCILFTKPHQNPKSSHWYAAWDRSNTIRPKDIGAQIGKIYKRQTPMNVVDDDLTPMWGPIDLRRHMEGSDKGEHARYLLVRALDAHNLSTPGERSSASRTRWVQTPW